MSRASIAPKSAPRLKVSAPEPTESVRVPSRILTEAEARSVKRVLAGGLYTSSDEGLDSVFHRIALRHPGFAPIREAVADLKQHRNAFESGFREFFPDLQEWVRALGPEADVSI